MSQYFENDDSVKDERRNIEFDLYGHHFRLESSNGVFSKDKLDTGTKILLETVIDNERPVHSVLDLGCGIGTVGVVLARFWHCHVTGIDINQRAVQLAQKNYEASGVNGNVLLRDGVDDKKYNCILLNPPIRAGKDAIYSLFDQCKDALFPGGSLWIVIRKQHGAASAMTYLESLGLHVTRERRDKGFWILKAEKDS